MSFDAQTLTPRTDRIVCKCSFGLNGPLTGIGTITADAVAMSGLGRRHGTLSLASKKSGIAGGCTRLVHEALASLLARILTCMLHETVVG